ncbi:hypothetical protein RM61_15140 [Xanthomonas phaseoli pv. phaseoli]|uniref:hypothetical protein n=1 Tax=Xanthomonas phaseoli TaxID=1985254 RepID=UPI000574690C|nr:hypothetical protein [Xanthomonas phaseoli]KHS06598.1 hypothetical protein RM61_15140 [Xanthomonas phaseoli pv. phaseoli]
MATNKVTVKSKTERGRWRAGLHFTRAGRSLSVDDELTDEQLRAIAEDPELVVLPYEESDEERQEREAAASAQAAADKAEAKRIDAARKAAEKEDSQRAAKDKKAATNPAAETGDASGEAGKSAPAAASEEAKDA